MRGAPPSPARGEGRSCRFGVAPALAGLQKFDVGKFSPDIAKLPGALGEEHGRSVAILGHLAAIGVAESYHVVRRTIDPARGLIRRGFEIRIQTIFRLETALEHIKLQLSDHADR